MNSYVRPHVTDTSPAHYRPWFGLPNATEQDAYSARKGKVEPTKFSTDQVDPVRNDDPTLETRIEFRQLRDEWLHAVAHLSMTRRRIEHPAYQKVIEMGERVIPFLIMDMERNQTHWFHALGAITGSQPVPQEMLGRVGEMVEAWVSWGRQHRFY